jgi:hypothetical protein
MKQNWLGTLPRLLLVPALLMAAALVTGLQAQQQGPEQEKLPPGAKLVRIEANPTRIELKHQFDYRQLLLTGILESGERIDVTRMAKLEQPLSAVQVSPRGQVRPVADGTGALKFSLEGQSVQVPVTVTGQRQKYQVSFVRDVQPVLSKIGCNAGTCHGSAKGKNGFRLSLRGYDPDFDYIALTDDVMGRRFDRSAPDRSLMLLKPTGEVPHVGGALIKAGEPYYQILHSWIADGVKFERNSARVKSIDVQPQSAVLPLPGMKQQMVIIATYTDGTTRDVTAESHLESSNTEVAKVDKEGLVVAVRRGETAVLARFEGAYAAAPLIIMGDRSGFAWQPVPEYNWIDSLVYEKLKQVKVLPSDVCSDDEFLRRIYLDLTGLPPSPEDVRAFLQDARPTKDKREAVVDRLIGSPDFVEHWTSKWADLLQVNSKHLGGEGAQALRNWIRQALADNMPYDQFCYKILTASGSNMENPPAAYWKILRKPAETMENTTHLFLAIRFNCNKCHDHPFERWTQDNYYHLAAYFAQVGLKEDPKNGKRRIGGTAVEGAVPLIEDVFDTGSGDVRHERTGQVAAPEFPFTFNGLKTDKVSRREQLAKWITARDNPYFARSYVNRIWSYLLGVGLIEPVDDIRAGNPPTNPKLLDRMTEEFIKGGYNVRELMRTICKSRTYQHSIKTNRWNADDNVNYSHALARRLPAEVLYDALHRSLGATPNLPGLPPGGRAAQIVDVDAAVPGDFLKQLGLPPRESACECERSSGMQLGPVLTLVNGPVINNALADPNNRISKLLAKEKDSTKVVEEMFLAILNRPPTMLELKLGVEQLQGHNEEHQKMLAHRKKLEDDLRAYEAQLDAKQIGWETSMQQTAVWHTLQPETAISQGGAVLKILPEPTVALDNGTGLLGWALSGQPPVAAISFVPRRLAPPDGTVLATGKNPYPETYVVTAKTDIKGITAVRLEVLSDPKLPAQGPGRAPNGNFVLNEFKLQVTPTEGTTPPRNVTFRRAIADFSQQGFEVQKAIDNNPGTGWAISPQLGKTHMALFEINGNIDFPKGTKLIFTLDQKFNGKDHNIGKFRLSVTTMPGNLNLNLLPENITKLLHTPKDKRSPQQLAELRNYYRSLDSMLPNFQRTLADYPVPADPRAIGAQDLAWALINSRAFLFNH